jgi:hypothetical protein
MLYADPRKIRALIGGSIILVAVLGLYLLQIQQTNADPALSGLAPQISLSTETIDEPVLGVFEGITPCSNVNSPLPQIPENTNCEQMIWNLTLNQDPATGDPTTYRLMSVYGIPQQGTTGLQGGGTQLNLEGKWTKIHDVPSYPNAVVYQLNPDDHPNAINFIKLDDNILHVLTQDMRLMLGNAAWSYTLNRTDKRTVSNSSATDPTSLATLPPPLAGEAASPVVFEGRIPCTEMVMALHNISGPNCQRVKLRLTLYQTTETPATITFELLSIYVGTGNTRYTVSGTWAILQGTISDLEAPVYQLNPNASQPSIFLLKADDNHLFLLDADFNLMAGDALLSFTLSRAE